MSGREVAPTCFSSRELPADGDVRPFMMEMQEIWGGQVKWARFTIVSRDFPRPPYPHGLYFEGWTIAPYDLDPPAKEAPFDFPLTTQSPDGDRS